MIGTGRLRTDRIVWLVLFALVSLVPGSALSVESCAPRSTGGDWPLYGNTPDNQRHQTEEKLISAGNASSLLQMFTFNTRRAGIAGTFSNTPIVKDGCVYVATSLGYVAKIDADTGNLKWRAGPFEGDTISFGANVISGSPTVVGDVVFVAVSRNGSPYVAALDRDTGQLLWTTTVDHIPSAFLISSPVHHDGLIFQGFSGYEFEADARGGWAILDASRSCSADSATVCLHPEPGATGGSIVHKEYTIDDADYARGYRGASIWCTAAVDQAGYAYACGGNPASKKLEHRYTNSLLKIDLDPSRPTFGKIVAAYKGNFDNYYPGLDRQPACDQFGDANSYYSAGCLQLDLDFGASPHLFENNNKLMVGNLQKSGVYHAVHADNLQGAWTQVVGEPCIHCNGSSPATDGKSIFVASSPGGVMWSLDPQKGRYRWTTPFGNYMHWEPVSVANGVVYTISGTGTLYGFDATTGLPVLVKNLASDTGAPIAEMNSSGVAIARNHIYAMAGDWLVAYRLP